MDFDEQGCGRPEHGGPDGHADSSLSETRALTRKRERVAKTMVTHKRRKRTGDRPPPVTLLFPSSYPEPPSTSFACSSAYPQDLTTTSWNYHPTSKEFKFPCTPDHHQRESNLWPFLVVFSKRNRSPGGQICRTNHSIKRELHFLGFNSAADNRPSALKDGGPRGRWVTSV